MKLVHAADLHLDSPLRGLGRSDDAPVDEIRGATRRAFDNLVALCVDEGAELLVIAGDLYDGDWKDYGTGLFFSRKMAELRQAGVEVVWIRGNHDAASKLTKHLRLPDNVRELGCRRPETAVFERLGVAVHGQGFASPALTDDISARYPEPLPGLFNVGLLHTALDGREGHAPYAPCKLLSLVDKGYDYWALGHVHQAEVLHRDPWVVFPGNLQGRHARETGAKGAVVVDIEAGRVRAVEPRALDVVRWAVCRVDATDAPDTDAVLDRVREAIELEAEAAESRLLAVRVVVVGATGAHQALSSDLERLGYDVRSIAQDVGPVWIERVELSTHALVDLAALKGLDGPIGELARSLDALQSDGEGLAWLAGELAELTSKLPPELRKRDGGLPCDDPAELRRVLADVAGWVLPGLMAEEGSTGSS
jgi:DNA repair exonuclease SbcCD nuclease subunit